MPVLDRHVEENPALHFQAPDLTPVSPLPDFSSESAQNGPVYNIQRLLSISS
jgi:hypothetical protein